MRPYKKLSKKQKAEVLKAFRSVFYKRGHWSCNSLEEFAGVSVRYQYGHFYDQDPTQAICWPGLGSSDDPKEKLQRELLLLFFAEAGGVL